jgi:hypothetical protein
MEIVGVVVGQILASNKRRAVYDTYRQKYNASQPAGAQPARKLASNSAVRWDSSANMLETVVENLPVLAKLPARELTFHDATKRATFLDKLSVFQSSAAANVKIVNNMKALSTALTAVRVATKEFQAEGVTVHLFRTVGDKMLQELRAYEGPAEVMSIVDVIVKEFSKRYTGAFPEEVAVAMYFIPEIAFDMYEGEGMIWGSGASAGKAWVLKQLLAAAKNVGEPVFTPTIRSMPPGPQKDAAMKAARATHVKATEDDIKYQVKK